MSVLGCNKSVVDCMCYKRGERGGGGRRRIFYTTFPVSDIYRFSGTISASLIRPAVHQETIVNLVTL